MGKKMVSYLAMKTDPAGGASEAAQALIESDLRELGVAARKLANHAFVLGSGLGFGTTFLKWLAFFAAVYLLILDRTNWKTNMLTALLAPYIFFTLPGVLFSLIRGEVGKWIAIIVVILRLFFPRHFPVFVMKNYKIFALTECGISLEEVASMEEAATTSNQPEVLPEGQDGVPSSSSTAGSSSATTRAKRLMSSTSGVWENFERITKPDAQGNEVPYVVCKICSHELSAKSTRGRGTCKNMLQDVRPSNDY